MDLPRPPLSPHPRGFVLTAPPAATSARAKTKIIARPGYGLFSRHGEFLRAVQSLTAPHPVPSAVPRRQAAAYGKIPAYGPDPENR